MIIIYNFVQHLRNEFPALDFYANIRENTALQVTLPDRCILVQDSGGPSQPWTKYSTAHFQVLNRDLSSPVAAKDAKDIFDELHGRFGLILPAALNVNGVNYPAVQVSEIAAIQLPYCIGQDGAGRTSFTTNYGVIYEES
jgi:hypothetical protein